MSLYKIVNIFLNYMGVLVDICNEGQFKRSNTSDTSNVAAKSGLISYEIVFHPLFVCGHYFA